MPLSLTPLTQGPEVVSRKPSFTSLSHPRLPEATFPTSSLLMDSILATSDHPGGTNTSLGPERRTRVLTAARPSALHLQSTDGGLGPSSVL